MLRRSLSSALAWAFPRGAHHRLILAAIGRNPQESLDAAHRWLAENDIDDAPFRDQRLLLAVMARFGPELKPHAAYPRLVGLQRLLWTRSLMTRQEAKAPLAEIADSGIEMLLIKGACRLALQKAASKQRAACDIDVVVRPEQMLAAFDILVAHHWTPSPGTSSKYLRERLSSTRSINLFKGNWGDIDLHSQPFHPGQGGAEDDARLWAAARAAMLGAVPVRVPCAEDRIALAVAHGALDGHTHSDWLVDCAAILQDEPVDWQLLDDILSSRRITVPAAVAFLYLKSELGFDIPETFLSNLVDSAAANPLATLSGLIQVRPKERAGPLGQVLRGIAKKQRKVSAARQTPAAPRDRTLRVRRIPGAGAYEPGEFVKAYRRPSPRECENKAALDVEIVLDVQPSPSRRRIEMEINSAHDHLGRVRFRKWSASDRPLRLRVSGRIPNPSCDSEIELVSRPSRQLRSFATESERDRYGSLAFRVVSFRVSS